jgi:hypothetical protein
MMRYFKYDDEYSEIAGGMTYVETDDGWAIRQLTINGDQYLASNINDPKSGMNLADGQIDYDSLDQDQVIEITHEAFEAVWQTVLTRHEVIWRQSQTKYQISMSVEGTLLVFYPQGVIVKLDDTTLGVANHALCHRSSQREHMYPGHKVTAIVGGYDEQNHWIVLDSPQVHEEYIG